MVNLSKLSEIVKLCKENRCDDIAREFNILRSKALCKAYCDFTYECVQIVDTFSSKYRKDFLDKINEIIHQP